MANVEDLRIIRFITGEEIMAEVTVDSNELVKVKNAVRIVVVPGKGDAANPSVGFAPFMQWSDDKELSLNPHHILTKSKPIPEFVNQYNGMFGGLVVPNSGLIKP